MAQVADLRQRVIEKRNKLEEKIKEQIEAFEKLIDEFFEFILNDTNGKHLVAKIKKDGNVFSYDEKLRDFTKLYTQYTIKNRSKLDAFFLQETKGNLSQLFDDFERSLINVPKNYQIPNLDVITIAAEPPIE